MTPIQISKLNEEFELLDIKNLTAEEMDRYKEIRKTAITMWNHNYSRINSHLDVGSPNHGIDGISISFHAKNITYVKKGFYIMQTVSKIVDKIDDIEKMYVTYNI